MKIELLSRILKPFMSTCTCANMPLLPAFLLLIIFECFDNGNVSLRPTRVKKVHWRGICYSVPSRKGNFLISPPPSCTKVHVYVHIIPDTMFPCICIYNIYLFNKTLTVHLFVYTKTTEWISTKTWRKDETWAKKGPITFWPRPGQRGRSRNVILLH